MRKTTSSSRSPREEETQPLARIIGIGSLLGWSGRTRRYINCLLLGQVDVESEAAVKVKKEVRKKKCVYTLPT